jgi:hypothetical protein
MTKLVVLADERKKQDLEDQSNIVDGLKKLLASAEKGEFSGVCYATVGSDDNLSFGILSNSTCGVHELVGVSQLLNMRLIKAAGV